MKKKEKSKLENAHVYNKEAKLHQYNKEWDKAIACFLKAMEFADDDDDFKIFYDSLLDVCRDKQIAQPFEERMAPYVKMMELIKDETAKPIGECLNFQYISDYTEFATVLAVYEEYDLLKRLINEAANSKLQIPESFLKTIFSKRSKPGFPQKKLTGPTLHVYSLLNTHLNPQFAHWGPTPLYLITSKNAVKRIKDIKKLLKFLVDNGADLNINARDRSNILLNQTARDCENIELLQIILELGADPDNSGLFIDDETDLTPLIHSLRPGYIEDENENEEDDDEDSGYITPFSEIAVKKAVLLLEHGADPNLLSSTILDDLSPLTMAIKYGFITQDGPVKGESPEGILELIKLLIKKGANVNFTDSNNNTPLSIAVNNNLSDVVNILKKKRAKMPVEKKKKEDTPEDLARIYWQQSRHPELVELCKEMLENDETKKSPVWYERLSSSLCYLGKWKEVLKVNIIRTTLFPDERDGWDILAIAHAVLGDYESAAGTLKEAEEKMNWDLEYEEPDLDMGPSMRAEFYNFGKEGDPSSFSSTYWRRYAMYTLYPKILKKAPKCASGWYELAKFYGDDLSYYKEAVKAIEKVYKLKPDWKPGLAYYAQMLSFCLDDDLTDISYHEKDEAVKDNKKQEAVSKLDEIYAKWDSGKALKRKQEYEKNDELYNRYRTCEEANDYKGIIAVCAEALKNESQLDLIINPSWLASQCGAYEKLKKWEDVLRISKERLKLVKKREELYKRYHEGEITEEEERAFRFLDGTQSELSNFAWNSAWRRLENEKESAKESQKLAKKKLEKKK